MFDKIRLLYHTLSNMYVRHELIVERNSELYSEWSSSRFHCVMVCACIHFESKEMFKIEVRQYVPYNENFHL